MTPGDIFGALLAMPQVIVAVGWRFRPQPHRIDFGKLEWVPGDFDRAIARTRRRS